MWPGCMDGLQLAPTPLCQMSMQRYIRITDVAARLMLAEA